MDRRQAKEILARYRPGETWGDPQVGEALEMVRHDRQLAEWFAKHRAKQAANPAASADGALSNTKGKRVLPLSKPVLLLMVVAVAVLVGIGIWSRFQPKPQDTFNDYRDRVARLIQRNYPLENPATELPQVREYFRARGGPVDFTLPRNLEKLPAKGSAVFPWRGHPVALMGFDAGANTSLYLFLIPRQVFALKTVPVSPQYLRVGRLLTVSWIVDDKIYLLAGPDDPALLQSYME